MDLTQITSSDFKRIAGLLEKKEALLSRINEIDTELATFGGEDAQIKASPLSKRGRPAKGQGGKSGRPVRKLNRAPRGQTKAAIIATLKQAGKKGTNVKEIAAKIGGNYKATYVWFQTTGKKLKEIKKVGPATFAWVE